VTSRGRQFVRGLVLLTCQIRFEPYCFAPRMSLAIASAREMAKEPPFEDCRPVLLCFSVLSCGWGNRKPVVVIDDWWNVDFARNACNQRAASNDPCVGDPVAEVRDFESELRTLSAGDPRCQGIIFWRNSAQGCLRQEPLLRRTLQRPIGN